MPSTDEEWQWELLPPDPPEAQLRSRREPRIPVTLPLRLSNGSREVIPAVILDLSASGVLLLVDQRFSPLLPVPPGAQLYAEFYLDDLEVKDALLCVSQVREHGEHMFKLGCAFVEIAPQVRIAIRAKAVAAASRLR